MAETQPISLRVVGDVAVATIAESALLESDMVDRLRQRLDALIDEENRTRLVLDLQNVRSVSSAGLGALIPLAGKILERRGDLVLCGARPEVMKAFTVTRLERQFRFCPDEAAALAALG